MSSTVRVTYYDTAMTLIEMGGLRLLTDPVLDPDGTIVDDGPVRLVKTASPPINEEALGRIDAVLLSHDQHADNLDVGGRALLRRVRLTLTTPAAAERLGGTARGLTPWASHELTGADGATVTVTAVPARHGPDEVAEIVGPVTGFVLATDQPAAHPIYISGDTIRFAGLDDIGARFAPFGLALLHIGRAQVEPLGAVPLSLSAAEAADLASDLQARIVVPLHFEGWRHLTEGRRDAEPAFVTQGIGRQVRWLNRGESLSVEL